MSRFVALLVAVSACLALMVAPAHAVDLPGAIDCKEAPVPEMPGRGTTGFLIDTPTPLPAAADPWAEKPTTSVYEQYGFAGLRWTTYDLGCGPDAARDPESVMGNAVANWSLEVPKFIVGLAAAVTEAAFEPTFLRTFDPMIRNAVGALREAIFDPYVVLFLAALGLTLLWRARQANLAKSAAGIGWALLVMVIAAVLFAWPVAAGSAADSTVTGVLGGVNASMSGQSPTSGSSPAVAAAGNLHNAVLYETWAAGTFGKANGEAAARWGPRLFDSRALTWHEAALPVDERKDVIEDKQEAFETVAAEVAEQDPDAYAYLTGQRSDARVGASLLALVAALCAAPFLIISGLLIIGAFLVVRLAVMFFPVLATLGVMPATAGVVKGAGNVVAAALLNCIAFGIGAAFTVLALGTLLSPDSELPGWLALLLMLLLTVTMFAVLRPFRSLSRMASPDRLMADVAGGASGTAGKAWGTTKKWAGAATAAAAGSYVGAAAAIEGSDMEQEAEDRRAGAGAGGDREPAPYRMRFEGAGQPSGHEVAALPGPAAPAAAGPVALPSVEAQQRALPAADVPASPPPPTVAPPPAVGPVPSVGVRPAVDAPEVAMPAAAEPVAGGELYVPGGGATPEVMPAPVEPEVIDGQEVFVLYRPETVSGDA